MDDAVISSHVLNKILNDWNDTDSNWPKDKTIAQLFLKQVKTSPNRVAIIFGKQRLTYQQLNEKSNRLARYIRKQYQLLYKASLQPDTLIAICLDRGIEMVIAMLAVLKASAAYVPIDPAYPDERIWFIFNDSKSRYFGHTKLNAGKICSQSMPIHKAHFFDSPYNKNEPSPNLKSKKSPRNLTYGQYPSWEPGET